MYNTPLPITGRDPDSVPFEECIAELEAAERDPVKAIRATRERRNQELAPRKAHHARGGPLALRGNPCSRRCSQRREVSILRRASARDNAAWLVILGYIG